MTFRVIISDEALEQVDRFLDYIAEDLQEPIIAIRWWEQALAKIHTLEFLPKRCPYAPGNDRSKDELRMLIVNSCLFTFHVDDETKTVHVVDFRHGSQDDIS